MSCPHLLPPRPAPREAATLILGVQFIYWMDGPRHSNTNPACFCPRMRARMRDYDLYQTLQIQGRWESNRNVWFTAMYFQKLNCYSQNRMIMFEIFTVNHSETHECGNWDRGRAIPRKGIHKWDFCCSERKRLESEKRHKYKFWSALV